ncbi:MAG: hypothetical protein QOE14_1960 [Humisphaera sp.]|nr:hypothetical protein [Humisphaera sp.]
MPHRAGFWIRVLATGIDVAAMLFIAAGMVVVAEMVLVGTAFSIAEDHFGALVYATWLIYTSFELWCAGTPGKLLLRMRIRNTDCSPGDFWRLFLRWSTKWSWLFLSFLFMLTEWSPLYVLSGFLSLPVVIGCFFAANDDHLTWHDDWAHTAVCYRSRAQRAFDAIVPPPPLPPPVQPPPNA